MFLIPYRIETIFTKLPLANGAIIVITSFMWFFSSFGYLEDSVVEVLVLQDWVLSQMVGSAFLHGDLFHLVGNMIFLWIFGNAVCAALGNGVYPFVYLVLAVFASAVHLMLDGNPAIGASGAVNGIVGMALIIYPLNRLHCAYGFSMPLMGIFWKSGRFSTKSFWMIILWLIFDILGVMSGGGTTAYWAHIGGFAFGMTGALLLVVFEVLETYDPTLVDILTGKKMERQTYDLQELAERTPGAALALPMEPTPPLPTTQIPGPDGPHPVFKVTSIIKKDNLITCLFFNEGDPVRDIHVESEAPIVAEISPAQSIAKRVNGWLKVRNANNAELADLKLKISYKAGAHRVTKDLVFIETEKKLVVEDLGAGFSSR